MKMNHLLSYYLFKPRKSCHIWTVLYHWIEWIMNDKWQLKKNNRNSKKNHSDENIKFMMQHNSAATQISTSYLNGNFNRICRIRFSTLNRKFCIFLSLKLSPLNLNYCFVSKRVNFWFSNVGKGLSVAH